MENNLITVMGTLGIGKTTYSTLLAERLGFSLVTENYIDNPFLPKFYRDMSRWAYHSQTFFLLEKARQLENVSVTLEGSGVVQDTPIFQDVYSYAQAQFRLGNMDRDEWNLYTKMYDTLFTHLPRPSLIVYLDASVDTIMQRIEQRGRSFEQSIPREYIALLKELNAILIDQHKQIPTVFIDCNTVDIVAREIDRDRVVSMVEQALHMPSYNQTALYA